METDTTYRMNVDLNVLNHLGVNLYSNIPSVLAEVVANAWDADAETVQVDISEDPASITISDDGHGMSRNEINARFLKVGYRRREHAGPVTPKHGRLVMGRKGIGKLSLFSIANSIEVQTARNGRVNGFTMSLEDVERTIGGGSDSSTYHPVPLSEDKLVIERGTRVVLTGIRRQVTRMQPALRRRLARRFSVIGSANSFSVSVNQEPIDVADRGYFKSLQYVWYYGERGNRCRQLWTGAVHSEARPSTLFEGWIGTTFESGQSKDASESLNKIVVMVRGKVAKEDILADLDETGLYSKYVIGQIHADFLDEDDRVDIATTSRQSIIEDDDRYIQLKNAVSNELRHIRNQWVRLRNKEGRKTAEQIEAIRKWFSDLGRDDKRRAEVVFGKINQIAIDDPSKRATLFKYGVLAFESLKSKQNLDAITSVSGESVVEFGKVFGTLDELESSLYHQIVSGRVGVVQALMEQVDQNAKERVIQEHLFDHLWLLDPSWERASSTAFMEARVGKEFAKITGKLTAIEMKSRIDIQYRTTAGRHVIVELKRPNTSTSTPSLVAQGFKYTGALRQILEEVGDQYSKVEMVYVLGRKPSDWSRVDGRRISEETLGGLGARVVFYSHLIENALKAYQAFLAKSKEAGRIVRLLDEIDESLEP